MPEPPRPIPARERPGIFSFRLAARKLLGPTTVYLEFQGDRPSPPALPGQFYMLRGARSWPVLLARPFSLASWREEGRRLGFLVEVVGQGTRALEEMEEGKEVLLWGPLGNAFPPARGAVLVAGGVGLAPFLLSLERGGPGPALVLFGGRTRERVASAALLPEGTPLELATDDGSAGFHGTVVDLLERLLGEGRIHGDSHLQVCGPEPMMAAVAALAERAGLPCLVSLETRMGCGLGICAGCAVDLRPGAKGYGGAEKVLACKAGPVFPAGDLAWEKV